MPKKIDPELRERAVRMVREHQQDYPSVTAASKAVAERLGLGRESVRRWAAQAEIDASAKPGVTSARSTLRSSGSRPRTSGCARTWRSSARQRLSSWGSSTPATADRGVHRRSALPGARGRVDLPGPARAGPSDRRAHLPVHAHPERPRRARRYRRRPLTRVRPPRSDHLLPTRRARPRRHRPTPRVRPCGRRVPGRRSRPVVPPMRLRRNPAGHGHQAAGPRTTRLATYHAAAHHPPLPMRWLRARVAPRHLPGGRTSGEALASRAAVGT